jgi:hypothetical protein
MRNKLLLALLLISTVTFAQSPKFRFGLSLRPAITDNILSSDGSIPSNVVNNLKYQELRDWGYSALLFAQYEANTRLKFQFGIGYSRTGYSTRRKALIYQTPEPGAPEYSKFEYAYHDLIVPVQLRYNLSKKQNTFYLLGGISTALKLSRTTTRTLWYANDKRVSVTDKDKDSNYNTLNLNGIAGFGYDIKVSPKINLWVQPSLECNVLGTAQSSGLTRRTYTFGISLGLTWG